ncbi:MAG: GDP-mannose 4,6-dehydratase [Planctomycetes bacterium]|nr:GDP-mannose 4,6-dehydratase [Planctomycetota bacterium]
MERVLIVGGAGFIGSNAAAAYLAGGAEVTVLDDGSRAGATANVEWLRAMPGKLRVIQADVRRDRESLQGACRGQDLVLHLAAQVAVTSSVADPRLDFEVNALGSFNLLEAARAGCPEAVLIYASTNKVYGGMEAARVEARGGRYALADLPWGVPESWPLDFHSPYGCSKGAADQYFIDHGRVYGLRTVVFRQSCIYGPRQFGVEDQGWVAWFAIASALGRPITVYGDGRQVRDVLWVDDLVAAFRAAAAAAREGRTRGRAYNIGGGPDHTLSVGETLELLGELRGRRIQVSRGDWRPGDQRVYVSDITRAREELGWRPRVAPREGLRRLVEWVDVHLETIRAAFP